MSDDPLTALAQTLADGINPVFAALLLAAPLADTRGRGRRAYGAWLLRGAGALAVAVPLAEAGKALTILPGHPRFPSGHTTFAAACAACLIARDKRWAWAAAPLAGLMGWALVRAGHHETPDVLGALVLGGGVGWVAGAARFSGAWRRTPSAPPDARAGTTPGA